MKRRTVPTQRRRTSRGSQHLLDVRVRRSTAKRQRWNRVIGTMFALTVWISLAVGVCVGFHAVVNRFFLQNPEYNLRIVEADLDGLMTRDEAMQIAGIQLGKNIFRINLAYAESALQKIDQVDEVRIQRDWPDRISIKLKKREPVAWLARAGDADDSHSLLLDADGRTMKPYRVEPEYWHLPVILAPNPELIKKGDVLAVADLKAALDLIAARREHPESLLDIASIDITKGYALEVVSADKEKIAIPPEDPALQLERLQKLLVACRDTGRRLDAVNLIPKKYTPVRFVLASIPEPPAEEPIKKKKGKN